MSQVRPPSVGKSIDYQAKQITYNVYTYYKTRKQNPKSYEYEQDINLISIVSEATGLSKTTVTRIIHDGNIMKNETGAVQFKPSEKKKHVRKKRIEVDEYTEGVIRKKVIQFYRAKKEVPSIRKLNTMLKKEKILDCSNEYLRQLLHKLGFTNAENKESQDVMIERPDISSQRLSYLKQIKEFRAVDRSIFFLNETKHFQTGSSDGDDGETSDMLEAPALIAIRASGTGFLDYSVIKTKMKSKTSGEEGDTFEQYENYDWVKDKFLTSIPPRSVIVLNDPLIIKSEPMTDSEKPSQTATRGVMQEWLENNNIPFKDTDTKLTLYQLITDFEEKYKFSISKLLTENGHVVLHLPQHHPDLNPVMMAWNDVKTSADAMKDIFVNTDTSRQQAKRTWHMYLQRVKKNEEEYYVHDMNYDASLDNLLQGVTQGENITKQEQEIEDKFEVDHDDSMEAEHSFE